MPHVTGRVEVAFAITVLVSCTPNRDFFDTSFVLLALLMLLLLPVLQLAKLFVVLLPVALNQVKNFSQ